VWEKEGGERDESCHLLHLFNVGGRKGRGKRRNIVVSWFIKRGIIGLYVYHWEGKRSGKKYWIYNSPAYSVQRGGYPYFFFPLLVTGRGGEKREKKKGNHSTIP